MKIAERLAVALDWAKVKLSEENFAGAVEMIEMELEYSDIEVDEAIDQWIRNTQMNYPEYFIGGRK